ncbi:hypothetical protein NQD77_25375, partial [Escherichia coli]|nr:hypothetical protein [Escherichia coli]
VTTVQKFPNLLNLRKTTSPGGFFVFRARDYDATERISRGSSSMTDRHQSKTDTKQQYQSKTHTDKTL